MKILLPALLLLLSACSAIDVDDYRATQPAMDLRTFFDGDLKAYGLLQDWRGRLTRRFTATLHGSWQGENGTLVEHFVFDDGEEQDRTWQLQHLGNGRYRGTAGDVVGGAEGRASGAVFQWRYRLDVPWQDSSLVLTLDDWLFLVDERHLLNRTALRKFGVQVGELTLVIEKI